MNNMPRNNDTDPRIEKRRMADQKKAHTLNRRKGCLGVKEVPNLATVEGEAM